MRPKRFTKPEWSWIMYDWANSIWATNIMSAIFPIFFAMIATDRGDVIYGYAVSIGNLAVAILAPYLGAIGDFRGMKKKLWAGFMIVGVVFTALMGIAGSWQLMLVGFVISRIGFSGSCLFYDSFLTDVTTKDKMDTVSSWGYSMGYIGGSTIPFIISIVVMLFMDMSELSYRIAILIVPVWWLIFSIPFWKNVDQKHCVDTPPRQLLKSAGSNMVSTFRDILKNKAVLFFVIAYFFYIDGVSTIISMATNYGSTLGLGTIGMILALLVTQLVAVPFTILFGKLSGKKGPLTMIGLAVIIYSCITIVGFFMGFLIDYYETLGIAYDTALQVSNILFWILATLVGTVQGGIQALSRSYFGKIIPAERSNEYYGFMDILGKFSCVIGPALYALVFDLTGKACLGILSLILLFIMGAVFLWIGKPHFAKAEAEQENAGNQNL